MPCLENKEPKGLPGDERGDDTKLQVELGLPTEPVSDEQVDEEAETAFDPQENEEENVQENLESA